MTYEAKYRKVYNCSAEFMSQTASEIILIGLGVDELSVSIPAIPAVKAQIRSLSLSTAKRLAVEALECASATEVRRVVDSLSLRTFSKTTSVEA